MKLRHNKKRNTAFLYEVLIRHLTKSVLDQDATKKREVSNIIKKHFKKGTTLREELDLYNLVSGSEKYDYHVAEKMLFEAKRSFNKIDKDQLFSEQSEAIKEINKLIGKDAYSVFIPNYKSLASIQQIFSTETPVKTRVLLEDKVLRNLCILREQKEAAEMQPIDNIVYRSFVKKFNEQYSEELLEEQRVLLGKYIASFADNGLDLKTFLSEEVSRLKGELGTILKKEEVLVEEGTTNKIKEVVNVIDGFREQEVNQEMVEKVLKIQSLVKEF